MKIRISVASLLALAMAFLFLLPVHAGSINDADWTIDTSGTSSGATATASDGKISLSAASSKSWFTYSTKTATIKLTNNTGDTQVLSGEMTFAGKFGSYTITLPDNSTITGSSAYTHKDSITLENGQSLTIKVTSYNNSTDPITCEYATSVSPRVSKTITCNTGSNGSYSVNGTAVTADNTSITYNTGDTITLTTTPNDGYVCLGFMLNETTLLPKGNTETLNWQPRDNYSIKPVFAQVATTSAPFKVNGTRYFTWETAMTAAGSSGTVVLAEDFTLPATYAAQGMTGAGNHVTGEDNALVYAVPAGVSLLIPYDDNNLVIQPAEADAAHANYLANTTSVSPKGLPSADIYRTLTIPQDITVKLSDSTGAPARLVVGGGLGASEGNRYHEGGTYGQHGNLEVNGELQLGNNSVLSTCGYVIGRGEISTTGSGAAIYQPMVLNDWRGAGQASLATNNGTDELYDANDGFPSDETTVSPFSQWGFINIRTDITLTEGNAIRAYCSLLEDSKLYTVATEIVSSNGLVILSSGATLTSEWQDLWTLDSNGAVGGNYPYPGQNHVTISGGASLGVLNMTIPDIGEFSTKDFTLPVCYNFDITLQGTADTPYSIAKDVALLPGAGITVDNGAVLDITTSRFVILDGLTSRTISTVTRDLNALDGGTYAATTMPLAVNTRSDGKSYPTAFELRSGGLTSNGKFVVNGTLSIGASTNFGGLIQSTAPGGTVSVGGTDGSEVSGSVMHGLIDRGWVNFHGRVFVGGTCHAPDAKILSHDGTVTTLLRGDTYYSIEYSDYLEEYVSDYYYGITAAGALDDAYTWKNQSATLKNETYPDGQPISGAWCKHVWVDATCSEPKTCSVCGAEDPNEPATGIHTDAEISSEDGYLLCDGCNKPLAKLSMNANADAETELVLKFEVHKDLYNKINATASFAGRTDAESTWSEEEGKYFLSVTQPVASGEMTKYLKVTLSSDSVAFAILGIKDMYVERSIVDYARAVLKMEYPADTTSQEYAKVKAQKKLVAALVYYGGFAQTYFDANPEEVAPLADVDLASDLLAETDIKLLDADRPNISNVTAISSTPDIYGELPDGITKVTQNAVLDAAISQDVFFYLTNKNIESYTFKLTYTVGDKENAVDLEPVYVEEETSDGATLYKYKVTINNIPAAYLDYAYTITINNTYTVTPSITAYLQRLCNNSSTDAQRNLAKAMYLYNQAANELFGK